jgi:hypothetical protein
MTEPEIIVERKKYGSSAMDYTMRVYQKLDEETIMIDGVKYQKVEEPKPQTLKDIIREWWGDDETSSTCDELLDKIVGWLPDELEYEEDEMGYNQGWNDCLNEIKKNLR